MGRYCRREVTKLKILMLSLGGDGAVIAHQLSREGHSVDLWIKEKDYAKTLQGVVNRVESFRPYVAKADFVICDMVGFSQYASMFRSLKKPVLCCNEVADVLELDRVRGIKMAEKIGMSMPITVQCKNVEEAKQIEWKNPFGYVCKPCGNIDTGKTYVCETKELYDWALSQYKPEQELIVQEVVDPTTCIEVSTEGWFNGTDWLLPFNHTFEEKRFLVGDLGGMTGCQGNVVMPLREPTKLVQETVMRMTEPLRRAKYRGPLDVNCLVTKDAALFLEFTARFGYDAIDALMYGLRSTGQFLFEVATGVAQDVPMRGFDYLLAVRLTRAPYPGGHNDKSYNDGPVLGIDGLGNSAFLVNVWRDKSGYRSAGADGILCKVVTRGRDIREAQRRCYDKVKQVKVMDLQYRTDIGFHVEKDIAQLKKWGWL
jgi:phosphoribosylamine-glycine ligase